MLMKKDRFGVALLAAGVVGVCGGVVMADEIDIWLYEVNGQLQVGAVDKDDNKFFAGERVFEGFFGQSTDGNFPNETDEPGWFTTSLPFGSVFGFNILDGLRVWNGSDFDALAPVSLTVTADSNDPGAPAATTGALGEFVPGFFFATPDANGFFDLHIDFVLNAPHNDGIYLLTLQATSDQFGNSLPFYLVLSQNIDEEELDRAVDFVRDVIIPAPGAVALFGMLGLAAARRRR